MTTKQRTIEVARLLEIASKPVTPIKKFTTVESKGAPKFEQGACEESSILDGLLEN